VVVHSALPDALTAAADAVLGAAGVHHAGHGDADPVGAAVAAAEDPRARALLGPYRSADVAEALEVTAPAGLALLAPVATWAGVSRDDEPGCDDPARPQGTVFRLLARDTEVAARLAADLRLHGRRALVVAGDHDYGRQLDGQLRLAGLPRADAGADADVIVLCGLAGEPEVARARALAPMPVVAFDGVQGADLGQGRDVALVLPFAPSVGTPPEDLFLGVDQARRAAQLAVAALADGGDRASVVATLRTLGPFDERGDPVEPAVWLWDTDGRWTLRPKRPLQAH
jgi:hypothetical protein